jgi:hypothetical protein
MKRFVAALIALSAAGVASADDQAWYVGADVGLGGNHAKSGDSGRVYLGYRLGSAQLFGMELVNAAEAQLYSCISVPTGVAMATPPRAKCAWTAAHWPGRRC